MQHGLDPPRVARIAAELAVGARDPAHTLCSAAAGLLGVCGASLVLMSGGRPLGSVCISDPRIENVEDAQYTLGEGPGFDAVKAKAPALEPDLESAEETRWPVFRRGALAAGLRAAFGFPLMVGTACIGALNLYHDQPGALTDEQLADAVAVAHVVGRTVLGWQTVAGPGALAWQLEQVPAHRAEVHQATGMVSVQAAVSVDDALVLVRAHAFAEDQPISAVANEIVAGRLRFG